MSQVVGIIGASDNPERYAYLAAESLERNGFEVVLVNPFKQSIHGKPCYKRLHDAPLKIDSVSVYVNSARFTEHLESVIESKPKRIVFNPGAEAPDSYQILRENNIEVIEDCTLVMLDTGQF
jgi:predicted CoA-binding protein